MISRSRPTRCTAREGGLLEARAAVRTRSTAHMRAGHVNLAPAALMDLPAASARDPERGVGLEIAQHALEEVGWERDVRVELDDDVHVARQGVTPATNPATSRPARRPRSSGESGPVEAPQTNRSSTGDSGRTRPPSQGGIRRAVVDDDPDGRLQALLDERCAEAGQIAGLVPSRRDGAYAERGPASHASRRRFPRRASASRNERTCPARAAGPRPVTTRCVSAERPTPARSRTAPATPRCFSA